MDLMKIVTHIQNIENFIAGLLSNGSPKIIFNNWRLAENLTFTDRIMLRTEETLGKIQISFERNRCRPSFTLILHFLAKIHQMLLTKVYFTKRELFYQEVDIVQNQRALDQILLIICNLLKCPPWELGIIATSKGLVAGPLLIKKDDENVIDCSSPGGTLIPHIVCIPDVELRSSAKYVLLIEKDATFQRLLNESTFTELNGALLVTGKGFPDINTRMLINKLNAKLKLPVLALMDADPFGIAIMCIYRFGSQNMSLYSENLVTPAIKWLGVHPSDILPDNVTSLPLDENDLKKLKTLSDLVFIKSHEKILKQIKLLLNYKKKAEIEAVCPSSSDYLTRIYIPSKILNDELY